MLKQGRLMAATVVVAQAHRPPRAAGNGAQSATDPDADWTYSGRGARTHFGYKVQLGVDRGSLLVRRAVLTPAKVYESEGADELACGDEGAVYGDRAYEAKARRQWLKSAGISDRLRHRAHKHQRKRPHWPQRRNELIGPIRALVEKVFGALKWPYRYHRVRDRGLGRNGVELWFKLMASNLRRAAQIVLNAACSLPEGQEGVDSGRRGIPEQSRLRSDGGPETVWGATRLTLSTAARRRTLAKPGYAKGSARGNDGGVLFQSNDRRRVTRPLAPDP